MFFGDLLVAVGCKLIIITSYIHSTYKNCWTEHYLWNSRSSPPETFLKISQNSQENACARALLKKKTWHRYFTVNFVKFLRTPIFAEDFWCLLLVNLLIAICPNTVYLNNQNVMFRNACLLLSRYSYRTIVSIIERGTYTLFIYTQTSGVAGGRCSTKYVFLKIRQLSQGIICAVFLFFNKVAIKVFNFIKKHSDFLWILQKFYEHLFHRIPLDDRF